MDYPALEPPMLSFHHPHSTQLCDGFTRRDWLRVAGFSSLAGLGNLALGATTHKPAKACIFLFFMGGPSQFETWDPKPDAPKEIRGEFQPISTSVPGIQVCELMPKTAQWMKRICAIRSLVTQDNAHSSSGYWMLTGVPHQPTNSENTKPGAPNDWPSFASIIQNQVGKKTRKPEAIVLPEHIWNDGGITWPGQDAGFLGKANNPWLVPCHPEQPTFSIAGLSLPAEITGGRFNGRLDLLSRINEETKKKLSTPGFEAQSQQAVNLLSGGSFRQAFSIESEPQKLRERYGINRWGQSVLLARRLVEAGVKLIQVNWTRFPNDPSGAPVWDTHADNANRMKNTLMPIMDQSYSALLEDLHNRGLLEDTLVVWAGEFGRTPRHNGRGGRDHWGNVFSAALAGGGIQGGKVIGASDKIGGYVKDNPVLPQDLLATIYDRLGFHPETEAHDPQGKPFPISRGKILQGV